MAFIVNVLVLHEPIKIQAGHGRGHIPKKNTIVATELWSSSLNHLSMTQALIRTLRA